MGLNAQTAVPEFQALEVLTAAEMTQINTGIPVFATTVTRDAAFGGAGEKVLAQGQYAYIEATSTLQVYNGSSWVSSNPTLGLTCIKATTTFSAAANIFVDNIFTTTYDNYLIILEGVGSSNADVYLRYRTGGVDNTSSTYNFQILTANSTSVTGYQLTATTSNYIGDIGTTRTPMNLTIQTPATATPTTVMGGSGRNGSYLFQSVGNFTGSTAFDGFKLYPSTGTFTGQYTIYAYSKTV